MHRVLVLILSALDAVIAGVAGIAACLAPVTVLWFVVAGAPDWSAQWQTAVAVWQLGHAVPLHITLPDAFLAANAIDPSLATFVVSLAPLGFAAFTLLFAARSGARAARAGAWTTGVVSGALVFTVLAAAAGLSARSPLVAVHLWQAVLFPAAIYVVGIVAGAVTAAWKDGDDGVVDALRARLDRADGAWPEVPELLARGTAIVVAGLLGAGALLVAVALLARSGQIVALSQSANLDLLGVIVVGVAQALFLPTLFVWGAAFLAGPGFAVGTATSVAPAGTQVGVVPGIPLLGIIPESTTPWLLVLILVPVGIGALAGWAVRSRLAPHREHHGESIGVQLVLTLGIAALSAAAAAVLSVLASGSLGPVQLADAGPAPGPVALAVGVEIAVGAGILLLSPRALGGRRDTDAERDAFPGSSASPAPTTLTGRPSLLPGIDARLVSPAIVGEHRLDETAPVPAVETDPAGEEPHPGSSRESGTDATGAPRID